MDDLNFNTIKNALNTFDMLLLKIASPTKNNIHTFFNFLDIFSLTNPWYSNENNFTYCENYKLKNVLDTYSTIEEDDLNLNFIQIIYCLIKNHTSGKTATLDTPLFWICVAYHCNNKEKELFKTGNIDISKIKQKLKK
jgi:hypothetical protein